VNVKTLNGYVLALIALLAMLFYVAVVIPAFETDCASTKPCHPRKTLADTECSLRRT